MVVNGCLRDSDAINKIDDFGIKSLGTHPRKTDKSGRGETNCIVTFKNTTFKPGDYIVADNDGVVVLQQRHLDVLANDAKKSKL